VKLELALKKELLQSGGKLAPGDATQRGDGQEESFRGGDPSGTVGCKTASRNHVVYVRGINTAGSGRGPWYLAGAKALSVGLSNAYFQSLGLPTLIDGC